MKGEYRLDEDIPNVDYVRPIAPKEILLFMILQLFTQKIQMIIKLV